LVFTDRLLVTLVHLRTGQYGWRQAKRPQSSRRIAVEHANAELRQ